MNLPHPSNPKWLKLKLPQATEDRNYSPATCHGNWSTGTVQPGRSPPGRLRQQAALAARVAYYIFSPREAHAARKAGRKRVGGLLHCFARDLLAKETSLPASPTDGQLFVATLLAVQKANAQTWWWSTLYLYFLLTPALWVVCALFVIMLWAVMLNDAQNFSRAEDLVSPVYWYRHYQQKQEFQRFLAHHGQYIPPLMPTVPTAMSIRANHAPPSH